MNNKTIKIPKSKPIQVALTVDRKEYLTPHYIRVYLRGPGTNKLAETTVGINNKILIPPKGVQEIYFPELDPETRHWKPQNPAFAPVVRTYTHRGINLEKNEIWIDFVVHGDEGPASAWAIQAQKGDALGVMMKQGKKRLYSPAENYILLGDATAIPVLACILEDLPSTAKGTCIIEVNSQEDEQIIETRADIDFIWLHNPFPQKGSKLSEVFKQQNLPQENRFAYIAAEFSTVKSIRNYLRKERHWERDELYAYSYWKSGVAENKSAKARLMEQKAD